MLHTSTAIRPTVRPPAQRQSALRAPLNDLFGTEGSVRLLRELSRAPAPMTTASLAERTRLDRSTARRSLLSLLDTGVVEGQGSGRQSSYQLRDAHPLTPAIRALFRAEAERFDTLIDDLKTLLRTLSSPPAGAWIEGPVAERGDEPGEPVRFAFVDTGRIVAERRDQLQAAVAPIEQRMDVTIDVQGMTPADIAGLSRDAFTERYGPPDQKESCVILLLGLTPTAFYKDPSHASVSRPAIRSHADHDARSRALGSAIAARLKKDPTLVARAMEYVSRRLLTASAREHSTYAEWANLLQSMSPARIRHFLTDPGPRATRLRQSMPFVGMLSEEERAALDAEITAQVTRAHDAV